MSEPKLTAVALPEELPSWGVLVLESHHAPDFSMEWRTHRFIKVVYALSGSGRILVDDSEFTFRPQDLIVVPPNCRNRIIDDEGSAASLYVLCVDTELVRFDPRFLDRLPMGALASSSQLAASVQRRLRRLLFEQNHASEATPVSMVGDAIQLLSLLIRRPRRSESAIVSGDREEVAAYIQYLDSHFFEATSIDDAATHLGLSRRRFTDLFKELTGLSWLAYVRRLCVEHAQKLLRETNMPITSVAFECGFDDLSTFYRQFKRHTGVAPGTWREQEPERG